MCEGCIFRQRATLCELVFSIIVKGVPNVEAAALSDLSSCALCRQCSLLWRWRRQKHVLCRRRLSAAAGDPMATLISRLSAEIPLQKPSNGCSSMCLAATSVLSGAAHSSFPLSSILSTSTLSQRYLVPSFQPYAGFRSPPLPAPTALSQVLWSL